MLADTLPLALGDLDMLLLIDGEAVFDTDALGL